MSRNSRARRLARKARPKLKIEPSPYEFGTAPGDLTPQEKARVLSRYANMRCRGFTFGFVPLLANGWVKARTPEELEAATAGLLETNSTDKPSN